LIQGSDGVQIINRDSSSTPDCTEGRGQLRFPSFFFKVVWLLQKDEMQADGKLQAGMHAVCATMRLLGQTAESRRKSNDGLACARGGYVTRQRIGPHKPVRSRLSTTSGRLEQEMECSALILHGCAPSRPKGCGSARPPAT
jgi:hypothetical protein